jgi:hypothetical protein
MGGFFIGIVPLRSACAKKPHPSPDAVFKYNSRSMATR